MGIGISFGGGEGMRVEVYRRGSQGVIESGSGSVSTTKSKSESGLSCLLQNFGYQHLHFARMSDSTIELGSDRLPRLASVTHTNLQYAYRKFMKRSQSVIDTLSVEAEPPATRHRTSMPLEAVTNDLDDDTHARLDEAVTACGVSRYDPSNPPFASLFLLSTIVSTSEGLLDPKYKETLNAMNLLAEHPDLMEKLSHAWKLGRFKDIRNLSAIWIFLLIISLILKFSSRDTSLNY